MPRRPPPSPLILSKGPIPPRGAPRHRLPDVPSAVLIVAQPIHHHSYNNAVRPRPRERTISSASSASSTSLSSNNLSSPSLSLSSYHPPLVSTSVPMQAGSSDTMTSSTWFALDVSRRKVVPPAPAMLAYSSASILRTASGSGATTGQGSGSRRATL